MDHAVVSSAEEGEVPEGGGSAECPGDDVVGVAPGWGPVASGCGAAAVSEFEIASDLEEVIMSCLAKNPADRPADARVLSDRLADCRLDDLWDQERVRHWWDVHDPCRDQPVVDE